jgi:predicted TIM-barrel fold metal-dependent hydrolase
MKKVYYDIASSTVEDIVAAEKIVGADHLLVGTDFPWGNTNFFRPLLKALPFPEDKIKAIAYDNASKLFRIQVEK